MRIARREDPLPGENEDRVPPLHVEQRLGQRGGNVGRLRARDEVQYDFRIRRGREERARRFEPPPDLASVDEVSVVRERERSAPGREDDRLRVREKRCAGRRVPHVTDGRATRKSGEPRFIEDVGDVAHLPFDEKLLPVERGDPGRLLPAVLERVEAQVRDVGGVLGVGDPENAAFVAESVPQFHLVRC